MNVRACTWKQHWFKIRIDYPEIQKEKGTWFLGGGKGGNPHIKRAWVLIGHSERNPLEVPRS